MELLLRIDGFLDRTYSLAIAVCFNSRGLSLGPVSSVTVIISLLSSLRSGSRRSRSSLGSEILYCLPKPCVALEIDAPVLLVTGYLSFLGQLHCC